MKTFISIERLIKYSDVPYNEIYRRAEKHFNVTYKRGTLGGVRARASKERNGRIDWIETEFYPNTNCAEYNEYNY